MPCAEVLRGEYLRFLMLVLALLLAIALLYALADLHLSDYHSSFEGDPDVILFGVQKGGTTSLTALLTRRFGLYVVSGPNSESQFFSRNFNDFEFNKYIEGFSAHRREYGNRQSFDGSTTYFGLAKEVIHRMKSLYSPESFRRKKFILSLREPISREFSWFAHSYGESKKLNPNFHDTFHDFIHRIFSSSGTPYGFYIQHLKDLLDVLPRDQLFIYNFEMMVGEKGDDVINRLMYFLGQPPVYASEPLFPHANSRANHFEGVEEEEQIHVVMCSDIRFLNQTFSAANAGLVDFINSHPLRPISEPLFVPFEERFADKCVEDDGTEVYLY